MVSIGHSTGWDERVLGWAGLGCGWETGSQGGQQSGSVLGGPAQVKGKVRVRVGLVS